MHAALAEFQQGLAVQRERLRDRAGTIGGVDDVVDDFQPVGISDLAGAPGTQVFSLPVEYHHRRILALEYVDAILRIGCHPADQPEFFSIRQFEKIANQLVGMFGSSNLCHRCSLPEK